VNVLKWCLCIGGVLALNFIIVLGLHLSMMPAIFMGTLLGFTGAQAGLAWTEEP
jgi:hypothetical protein